MRKLLLSLPLVVLFGFGSGCEDSETVTGRTLSLAQKKHIVTIARRCLEGETTPASSREYPELYGTDRREVFCTLFGTEMETQIAMGEGKSLAQSVLRAALQIKSRVPAEAAKRGRIKIDIVYDEKEKALAGTKSSTLQVHDTMEGVILSFNGRKVGLLPEEIASNGFIPREEKEGPEETADSNRRFREYLQQKLGAENFQISSTSYRTFTTLSFVEAADGGVADLFRGKILNREISSERLYQSAVMAGEYLKSAVLENGRFVYLYYPTTEEIPEKYNMLRHAGTTYSLLELYELNSDQEILEKSRKALDYLKSQTHPPPPWDSKENFRFVLYHKKAKLGGSALALLALCKYEQVASDKAYRQLAVQLAEHLVFQQEDNGHFKSYYKFDERPASQRESSYYPGEAILALTRLYQLEPQKKWLEAAEKGADYLINVRDGDVPESELLADHWLMMALNELYGLTKKRVYSDHCFKIGRTIVQKQRKEHEFPDWVGSYYNPPRSTPSATRSEGLIAACKLARSMGEDESFWLEAIQRSLVFQLNCQFTEENVIYLPNPSRALGGLKASLEDFSIRIDYVQHNLSSFIGARDILQQNDEAQ